MRQRNVATMAVGIVAAIAVLEAAVTVRRGFSARDEPSAVERVVARAVRRAATPARARDARNPVRLSQDALADARTHFADHCATCHANDGSGNTAIGRNLYPKAPDMRLPETQRLTDGELYYIIENGIRLTGMPAWGKAGDPTDEDTWKLVAFIRHLKDLTPEQLEEMEAMNPKTPQELEEERQEREFLNGAGNPVDAARPKREQPHHKQEGDHP